MRKVLLSLIAAMTSYSLYAQTQSASTDILLPTPSELIDMGATMTYKYYANDDGEMVKTGPLSIKGSTTAGASYANMTASYNLTTTMKDGKINGALSGTGKEVAKTYRGNSNTTYTITGSFINGNPNGAFSATISSSYSATGAKETKKATANFKNGILVGAFSLKTEDRDMSGSFNSNGELNGRWKLDQITYEFLNGVLVSETEKTSTTPASVTEMARKLGSKSITKEELKEKGYICLERTLSTEDAIDFFLRGMFGISKIGGYDFSKCCDQKYIALKQIVMFTETGFEEFKNYYGNYLLSGDIAGKVGNSYQGVWDNFRSGEKFEQLDDMLYKSSSGLYTFHYDGSVSDSLPEIKNYKQYVPEGRSKTSYYGNVYLSPEQTDQVMALKAEADSIKAEKERKYQEELLAAQKRAEEERLAAERKAEEARLAAERKAEEARLAAIAAVENSYAMVRDNSDVLMLVVDIQSSSGTVLISKSGQALKEFCTAMYVDGKEHEITRELKFEEGRHYINIKATNKKYIPENAFTYIRSLVELHIPSCISKICANNFIGCPNLKDIYFYSPKAPKLEYFKGNIFKTTPNELDSSGREVRDKHYYVPASSSGYGSANYEILLGDIGYQKTINDY